MNQLLPLLGYLNTAGPKVVTRWGQWQITPITGGGNNRLYHIGGEHEELAVKFTIRDSRNRAGREYAALHALRQAGLDIAPRPIMLEQERYAQPVVVQSWLDGAVVEVPPSHDADWHALVGHVATFHTLTPDHAAARLLPAALTMDSAASGQQRIREQLAHIPPEAQSPELRGLVGCLARIPWPEWPVPQLTLCRCDPTPRNFIRYPDGWRSVDWENSGWGDPAFEIAEFMTHPAYAAVPIARWHRFVETYRELRPDDSMLTTRIRVYYRIMLVWWVARLARTLYEAPRGLDQRLVARPASWPEETQAKYERYLRLALAALSRDATGHE